MYCIRCECIAVSVSFFLSLTSARGQVSSTANEPSTSFLFVFFLSSPVEKWPRGISPYHLAPWMRNQIVDIPKREFQRASSPNHQMIHFQSTLWPVCLLARERINIYKNRFLVFGAGGTAGGGQVSNDSCETQTFKKKKREDKFFCFVFR